MIGNLHTNQISPFAGNNLAAIIQPYRFGGVGGNQTNGLRQRDILDDIS